MVGLLPLCCFSSEAAGLLTMHCHTGISISFQCIYILPGGCYNAELHYFQLSPQMRKPRQTSLNLTLPLWVLENNIDNIDCWGHWSEGLLMKITINEKYTVTVFQKVLPQMLLSRYLHNRNMWYQEKQNKTPQKLLIVVIRLFRKVRRQRL